MQYVFRPLTRWPYKNTSPRRSRAAFSAPWSNTMKLLERELRMLHAYELVIGADFREQDLRLDGLPRSHARVPEHPGVELSFMTKAHGRLVYASDSCEWWEHNVRSLALTLEALRAVDRFGGTRRGEQYAGFRQIAATSAARQASVEWGLQLVDRHGGVRAAQRATHPDNGGDAIDFQSVMLVAGR